MITHTIITDFYLNDIYYMNAGQVIAHQMVELIHGCEKQHDHEDDHCWRILRVAECFKRSCVERGIAPTMEIMITEFIMEAEVKWAPERTVYVMLRTWVNRY